jgi:GTP-binding protein Era
METHCGYIALLGRPNAGKSTLLNACLGQKIAGVSQKPQTTRNRILGIDTAGDCQMVFLDTPGLHKSQGKPKINHMMNREAWSVVADADLICYLIDAKSGWHEDDERYLSSLLGQTKTPLLILATKVDAAKHILIVDSANVIKNKVRSLLSHLPEDCINGLIQPYPYLLSAKRPEEIKQFRTTVSEYMPKGPFLYDPENLTDRPESFVVGEMIREQIFRQLGEELPYGTSVVVEEMTDGPTTKIVGATIIVSRQSHKPIVIGHQGRTIKSIGTAARETLVQHFGSPVFLNLYVKVQPNWIDNSALVSEFQGIN